ncbi:MAG: hypothetical protein AAFO89_11775 [Planctomycetota bacterium]
MKIRKDRAAVAAPCAAVCAAFAVTIANAQPVLWDETVNGSFSSDRNNPTALGDLPIGSAVVRGTTIGNDVFSFTVPAGATVQDIILTAYTTDGGPGVINSGFNLFDDTGAFITGPSFGPGNIGDDILDVDLGPLNPPLVSLNEGFYGFDVIEFGLEASWELTFDTVPAPSAAVTLALAGGFAARRRR